MVRVERYLLEELAYAVELSTGLLQKWRRRACGHLYEWAGQGHQEVPNVGAYLLPDAHWVPLLLCECLPELRHRQGQLPTDPTAEQVVGLLAYAPCRVVAILPFTEGSGRTARVFTNLLAYSHGY